VAIVGSLTAACASSVPHFDATVASSPGAGFVEVRGVRLHYRESAAASGGPTLLLIHGFGGSTESWNDVLPLLSETHDTVRLDLKGFGLSDKPRDSNYSLDEQAELVSAVVESSRHPRLVLVGHSYGGAVAFLSYLKLRERGHAGRVAGMVLIDAAAYDQDPLPFFLAGLRNPLTRFIAEHHTTRSWRTRVVLRRLFVDKTKVDGERVERYAKYLRLPGAEHAMARAAAQVLPPDAPRVSARLTTIDVPTCVIWGEKDPAIPLALGRSLASDIPRATLAVVANVGHMPHEEAPRQTADLILRFTDALP
jgi:pimeloyl-ACP methyl ester carboxylesterase